MSRLREFVSKQRALLKEAFPSAREVATDPVLRKRWLLSARRAQMILLAVFVIGLFVFPPVRDWLAQTLFPGRRGGWFSRRARVSEEAETFASVLSFLYWFSGLGTALGALILHAPKVLGRSPATGASAPSAAPRPDPVARTMNAAGAASSPTGPTGTLGPSASGPTGTLPAADPSATADPEARTEPPPAPGVPPGVSPSIGAGERYRIESELGRGGMGVVYLANDTVLQRPVALKQLPPSLVGNPVLAERFRTEARVLARLTHPGIVQVFDLVENEQGMFMAMELVRGGSLDGVLEDRGALPVAEVGRLGAVMAQALGYAHREGVVHRDFKPHNVLLGDDGTPKITDFGLAKIARDGPKLTQEGAVLGSPAYMSPEQASGGVADRPADIYSFGVTLYEMATGRCPFEGDTVAILSAHITQPPPEPRTFGVELPDTLGELLQQMLAKNPDARPIDLDTVAETLRSLR